MNGNRGDKGEKGEAGVAGVDGVPGAAGSKGQKEKQMDLKDILDIQVSRDFRELREQDSRELLVQRVFRGIQDFKELKEQDFGELLVQLVFRDLQDLQVSKVSRDLLVSVDYWFRRIYRIYWFRRIYWFPSYRFQGFTGFQISSLLVIPVSKDFKFYWLYRFPRIYRIRKGFTGYQGIAGGPMSFNMTFDSSIVGNSVSDAYIKLNDGSSNNSQKMVQQYMFQRKQLIM